MIHHKNYDNFFSDLKYLPKTGPILSKYLSKLVSGNRWVDLLYHQPTSFIPRKFLPNISTLEDKDSVILSVIIEEHIFPDNGSQTFKILAYSKSGYIHINFFHINKNFILQKLPLGKEVDISGKISFFKDIPTISHPEYILPSGQIDKIPKNQIIYPLTAKITQKLLSEKIFHILKFLPKNIAEWIDDDIINKYKWLNWQDSVRNLHNPLNFNDISDFANNKSRRRLAFDELLAIKIIEIIYREKNNKNNSPKDQNLQNISCNILVPKLLEILPFELTDGQKSVLKEIQSDLEKNSQMTRLLQGDVGSGKTIIALISALIVIENNKQIALISPISLLATQHFNVISKFLSNLDINIAILTSKNTKKQKNIILENLKSGKINLLIGTQSLLQDDVIFKNLGLIIIDEQHRFGVMQRAKLIEKGKNPDILAMSATPIPRSLMMSIYGDMDISILKEKPKNRQEITTSIISMNNVEKIYSSISKILPKKEKIYWICPLIEENEESHLISLEERFKDLKDIFKEKIEMINGKMKDKEKDKIMSEFIKKDGEIQILLSTTVIEVGVDVPDATIIIIENAENFGLSQLHQLRGRVGRSDKKSFAILMYGKKTSLNGKKRLQIMKNSSDGFFIAEEDLKMRGFGEIIGTKQSGLPEYKVANLDFDFDLIELVEKNAKNILSQLKNYQELSKFDYKNIAFLLRIFSLDSNLNLF